MGTTGAMSGVSFEYNKDGNECKVATGFDSPLPPRTPEAHPGDASLESPTSTKDSPPLEASSPAAKELASLAPEVSGDFDITGAKASAVGQQGLAGGTQSKFKGRKGVRPRGWLWVILQASLFSLIIAAPSIPIPGSMLPAVQHSDLLSGFGAVLGAVSVGLLFQSFFDLGNSFTLFPEPLQKSELKTLGSYSLVRHPMYLAESLLALSVALLTRSTLGLYLLVPFVGVLVGKAKVEEIYLHECFGGEFATYRHEVKRFFFPGF